MNFICIYNVLLYIGYKFKFFCWGIVRSVILQIVDLVINFILIYVLEKKLKFIVNCYIIVNKIVLNKNKLIS